MQRSTAILFPGQGSLTPEPPTTPATSWPELVDHACELLGDDPFERAADSTAFAQPAIFVASMAGWREREPDLRRRLRDGRPLARRAVRARRRRRADRRRRACAWSSCAAG